VTPIEPIAPLVSRRLFARLALASPVLLLTSHRGEALDARFKDSDGDLVADTPADPKDQADPSTLIFAYTPV